MTDEVAPINPNAPRYQINSIWDIADIPAEALPRFYAELPSIVESLRQARDASGALAENSINGLRSKHPFLGLLISEKSHQRIIKKSLESSPITWVDDKDREVKCGEISMRAGEGLDPFFKMRVKL